MYLEYWNWCGPCQHWWIFASAGVILTRLLRTFSYVGLSWVSSSTTGEVRNFHRYEQYLLIIFMINHMLYFNNINLVQFLLDGIYATTILTVFETPNMALFYER